MLILVNMYSFLTRLGRSIGLPSESVSPSHTMRCMTVRYMGSFASTLSHTHSNTVHFFP